MCTYTHIHKDKHKIIKNYNHCSSQWNEWSELLNHKVEIVIVPKVHMWQLVEDHPASESKSQDSEPYFNIYTSVCWCGCRLFMIPGGLSGSPQGWFFFLITSNIYFINFVFEIINYNSYMNYTNSILLMGVANIKYKLYMC